MIGKRGFTKWILRSKAWKTKKKKKKSSHGKKKKKKVFTEIAKSAKERGTENLNWTKEKKFACPYL